MRYLIMLIVSLTVCSAASNSKPSPLTPEQIARLQELIRTNRATNEAAKLALNEKQRQLTKAYGAFELDSKTITALQKDIVGLQQQLLTNYNHLQVELRKTVGKERFATIKRRIDLHLKKSAESQKPKAPIGKHAPPTR